MGCGMTYLPSELGLTPTEIQRDPRRAEEEGINFGVALSVIEGLIKLASLDSIPTPPVPPPTALLGGGRDGMSARRCAANHRKNENHCSNTSWFISGHNWGERWWSISCIWRN